MSSNLHFFPISANQEKMYVFDRMYRGSCAYNISIPIYLDFRDADVTLLVRRLRGVVQANIANLEAFWFAFSMRENAGVGLAKRTSDPDRILSIENCDDDADIMALATERHGKPFDIEKGPLGRIHLLVQSRRLLILVTMHHIVADGWSLRLIAEQIEKTLEGRPIAPDEILNNSRKAYAEPGGAPAPLIRDIEADLGRAPDQRLDAPFAPSTDIRGEEILRLTTPAEGARIIAAARAAGVTVASSLFGAFCATVAETFSLRTFICLASTIGRRTSEFARTVGYFSNIVPVPVWFPHLRMAPADLRSAGRQLVRYKKHRGTEFGAFVETPLGKALSSNRTLMNFCFMQQKFGKDPSLPMGLAGASCDDARFGGFRMLPFHLPQQCGQFPLALEYMDITDQFVAIVVKYRTAVITRELAERIVERTLEYAAMTEHAQRTVPTQAGSRAQMCT